MARIRLRHAKRRAWERFGWNLSDAELRGLANRVRRREASFVEKQSNRVSLFDLRYRGKTCRVAYDKSRQSILTFLNVEGTQ